MRPADFLAALVSLIALSHCTSDPVVMRIGTQEIRASDVALRDQIVRIYFPQETRSLGLTQLAHSYSAARIMEKYGRLITDQECVIEEARIRAQTRSPETLARIERLFDGDKDAFRRIFVFPALVDRVVYYDFFLRDPNLQAASRRPAEEFLSLARATSFAQAAKKMGFRPLEIHISEASGVMVKGDIIEQTTSPDQPPSTRSIALEPPAVESSRWNNELLKGLKPGALIPRVIDRGEQWVVARYLRNDRKGNVLEGIFFKKADFSSWFEREKAKL